MPCCVRDKRDVLIRPVDIDDLVDEHFHNGLYNVIDGRQGEARGNIANRFRACPSNNGILLVDQRRCY